MPPEAMISRSWTEDGDWLLMSRIGRGDQAALAALYRQHYNRLRRFIFRITSDQGGLDDIVNEVMMVVWQKAASTTPQSKVSTWILGIAYRKALKAVVRGSRNGPQETISDEMAETIGEHDMSLAGMETEQLAQAALALLPVEQRAVMELVYREGLNYGDIAVVLGCPENTVKTRIFHARNKLRAFRRELTGTES
jgi:RNA polymerase sigma-70 factor (ECF subfamily)